MHFYNNFFSTAFRSMYINELKFTHYDILIILDMTVDID